MALEAIHRYMSDQNRPFSANDVFENLNKQFGKTEVQKTLDKLVSQDKVLEKTYGKQKVYCVRQPEDSQKTKGDSDADLRDLDKNIGELEQSLQETEGKLVKGETELRALVSTMTTEEARAQKTQLEDEIQVLNDKLSLISGKEAANKAKPVSQEEISKIATESEKMAKEYRRRKKICMEIVNSIMEGYPKSKKNLIEEVGLEMDEDVGFKLE